jgi:hypothetical protein
LLREDFDPGQKRDELDQAMGVFARLQRLGRLRGAKLMPLCSSGVRHSSCSLRSQASETGKSKYLRSRRTTMLYSATGLILLTCAILAAKWASELGFRQTRQVLWAIAGLLLGPIALLILYVRCIRDYQSRSLPGGRW